MEPDEQSDAREQPPEGQAVRTSRQYETPVEQTMKLMAQFAGNCAAPAEE